MQGVLFSHTLDVEYVKPEAVSNASQELDTGVSRNERRHREYLSAKL